MTQQKDIYVYMGRLDTEEPIFLGILHSELIRGKEIFSYENNPAWLKHARFRALDPDLSGFVGKQYLPDNKRNFGLFLDSAPDRWGRALMRRREAMAARAENRPPRTLTETDFLMGIYDGTRMGALRFKFSPEGEFMDNNRALTTPPWTSIRELEQVSLLLEKEEPAHVAGAASYAAEQTKWLNMLIAPGSSLGGARPKANILDEKGHLWIAKFPSGHDTKNMGAWEYATARMAHQCGIMTPECKVQKFGSSHHTFLTKRFDRSDAGRRIHFASAMTLLGYTDGASYAEGVSYLELAEWMMANCDDTTRNLEQLWRRIAFNIAVSNCDDHLRNHGFILTGKGWQLSPAYDLNPDENGMGLKLNISEADNSLNFDLALSVSGYFGLNNGRAKAILDEIASVVSGWRKHATQCDIPRSEQELVAGAFRY